MPSRNCATAASPPREPLPAEACRDAKCCAWSITSGNRARNVWVRVVGRICGRREVGGNGERTSVDEKGAGEGDHDNVPRSRLARAPPRVRRLVCTSYACRWATKRSRGSENHVQVHDHPSEAIPQASLTDEIGETDASRLRIQRVSHARSEGWWDCEVCVVSARFGVLELSCMKCTRREMRLTSR